MDGTRAGETFFNLPVIPVEDLPKLNVAAVIIIAATINLPVIYRRIAKPCAAYGIKVYDINGEEQQLNTGKSYKFPDKYCHITKQALIDAIDANEVISFDIFDTLITRKLLRPDDIFTLIERKYSTKLPDNYNFAKVRKECERELYSEINPTIHDIYNRMASERNFPSDLIDEFIDIEIKEETLVLIPRKEMLEVFTYAKNHGKTVACTSDMYFLAEIIKTFLSHCGYDDIDEILVSCDYGVPKSDGLFEILRDKYPDKKILHIGDNHDSDIIKAKEYCIDSTFEIESGFQMLNDSAFSYLLDSADTLDDRFILGELTATALNNPFIFTETKGKCPIKNCYELGYFLIEPLIERFIYWMVEEAKADGIDHMLLGSRDGWLIKKLLDIYSEDHEVPFKYSYFYTSRTASTSAGVATKEDIEYTASMGGYEGNPEKMMKVRFLLEDSDLLPREENEADKDYIARHTEIILAKAKKYKNNYLTYANPIIKPGEKLGFFDYVSSGTCQLWLENILGTKLQGYYFARHLEKYKEKLSIKSFIKPKMVYEKPTKFYKDYLFLEDIMTSPEPTLSYFDNNGNPLFEEDDRTKETISSVEEIHEGIISAFKTRKTDRLISEEFAEDLLDTGSPEYSQMNNRFINETEIRDVYCNRKYTLEQILKQ